MTDEEFVRLVLAEAQRARGLFPPPNAMMPALVEEVGEIAKALMYEPWNAVINECVQTASMALRLATEGDSTMIEFRNVHVHDNGRRYGRSEHIMPNNGGKG